VENKLNELADQEFRIADSRVTGGRSAEAMMEKAATPPGTYHYMVVHATLARNVQKNMNNAAADGYRLVRHTVATLRSGLTLIMEKPPAADAAKLEYRVSCSWRDSNAEEHLVEDQQEGFVLVEAVHAGQTWVLTQKAIDVEEANR